MAGDLPVTEGVFVLAEPWAGEEAFRTFGRTLEPRHVLHEFGPRVRIAAAAEQDVAYADVRALEFIRPRAPDLSSIDRVGALGLAAFSLRSSEAYMAMKTDRPLAGASWDTEQASSPDPPAEHVSRLPEGAAGAPRPPQPMRGRIGVGVVIVDGPTEELAFSEDERTLVVAEVQNGLGWLGSQAPGGDLTWTYDIRPLTLDISPDAARGDFDALEARWRDPALAAMGYGPGMAGADAFVAHLRRDLGVERAYCAFFTKYPIGHFAYAWPNGPYLVMDFANDGWGSENIDSVLAHETGHIFGAPDEYSESGCDCGGSFGTSGGPNTNCANCAPGGGVLCIMGANKWALCSATPGHFGW